MCSTSISEKVKAVDIASETGLDIDDAIQYAVALSVNAEAIISFDKHFDDLKIPRKEPKDIVNLKMQNPSKPTTTKNPTHYAGGGGRPSIYP